MDGVDPLTPLEEGAVGPERTILLFDGADPASRDAARVHWSALKGAGKAISYWREDEAGHWAKLR
jgi:DNA polymerase-3 subunit chi